MPRNKIFTTIDSPFSSWHRSQHDGVNMVDLDVVGICPACAKPLFLADTIYNVDFRFSGKDSWHQTPYKFLAAKQRYHITRSSIPVDESKAHRGIRPIIRFDIFRIYPHCDKKWRNLSPDNMLQFLEHMALKSHGPDCAQEKII